MKRILVLSSLALALTAQVASADHRHRDRDRGRHHRATSTWSAGIRVEPRVVVRPRVVVDRPRRVRVVRRPIYVQRPAIRVHYYSYSRRPAVLAENYASMAGYYWVAGAWSWNGYEWIWTAGHYEPDPSYVEPGYYDDYSPGFTPAYESSYPYSGY